MPTPAAREETAALPPGAGSGLALVHSNGGTGSGTVPDHELLLSAVAQRLRACADPATGCLAADPAGLCECAQALDRLRPALARARLQRERAARDLALLRGRLAAARLALADTRASEQQARHLAGLDELTALPLRNALHTRLEDALTGLRGSEPSAHPVLAVMFIDLDGFKAVNDRHGHAVGDELLRIVAKRLRRALRAQDLVSRVGGDEFACVLATPIGREHLSHVASKLYEAVSAPVQMEALALSVRPSIGIAMCPGDGDSAPLLLQRADAAMYRAKRRQLGYAFFEAPVDA